MTVENLRANQVFSFTVDPARVQGKPVFLRLYFADSLPKKGVVILNGNSYPIQGGDRYAMPISSSVRPGTNTIQFEARESDFGILKFEVITG